MTSIRYDMDKITHNDGCNGHSDVFEFETVIPLTTLKVVVWGTRFMFIGADGYIYKVGVDDNTPYIALLDTLAKVAPDIEVRIRGYGRVFKSSGDNTTAREIVGKGFQLILNYNGNEVVYGELDPPWGYADREIKRVSELPEK